MDVMEIAQVVDYIIAYSCKGNATLKEEMTQTRNLVMHSSELTGCQQDVYRICRQVLNKAASSRLISKQEATVMLAGLPFTYCTETVESVSVSSSKSLGSGGATTSKSVLILPMYKERLEKIKKDSPEHHFLSLLSLYDYFHLMKNALPPAKKEKNIRTFLRMHAVEGGNKSLYQLFLTLKYKKNPHSISYVIPNFVGIKTKPCYPICNQYARAVILIYKPWTVMPLPSDDWTSTFNAFIYTQYCPKSVQLGYARVVKRHFNKTTHLEPKQSNIDHSSNPISEADQAMIDLLGMGACNDESDELNIQSLPKGLSFNWNPPLQKRSLVPHEKNIPPQNWVMHKVGENAESNHILHIPVRDDGKPYTIDSLYPDQQEIMIVVLEKVKEWMTCRNLRTFKPLHMTINGPGGSGKSVLIKTIVSVLRTIYQSNGVAQVAAPTGSAAFNVNGETLHRLVNMGISSGESLSKAKEKRLVAKFSDLLCLIIDKRSLLSASDLGRAEKRIKGTIHNSLGNPDQYFGGLPVVILVGDDYQLPAQDGIIQNLNKQHIRDDTSRGIEILQKCGECVMHLSTSRRMADSQKEQKQLMSKIRLGGFDLTKKDVDKLLSLDLENIKKKHGNEEKDSILKKSVSLLYEQQEGHQKHGNAS